MVVAATTTTYIVYVGRQRLLVSFYTMGEILLGSIRDRDRTSIDHTHHYQFTATAVLARQFQ